MNGIHLSFLPEQLDDDFAAICAAMTPRNVIETELLLHFLKRSANEFFNSIVEYSENVLNDTNRLIRKRDKNKSLKQEISFLNQIIYRTPTNSVVFMEALFFRIAYFFRNEKFSMAKRDILYLKSFESNHMTAQQLVDVETFMYMSNYFMREMREARIYLDQTEELLDQFTAKKLLPESSRVQTILGDLSKFKAEIREFTTNARIQFQIKKKPSIESYINSDCEFRSTQLNNAGALACNDIAKGQVVIVEQPHFFQFLASFTNCEVCGVYQEHLYTCRDCRYRSYCSMTCMKSDGAAHIYECYGYKIGLIPMLETTILFRCFVQAAQFLSPAFNKFRRKNGPIRDATTAWHFIVKHCSLSDRHQKTIVVEFLSRQPNCKLLSTDKWRQLITNSFCLAVFVHNDTIIQAIFFDQLELCKDESIKLIGAILMRLSVHIMLNSQRDELQFISRKFNSSAYPAYKPENLSRMDANVFEYYDINAHSDFVDCFQNLQELTQNSIKHVAKDPMPNTPHCNPMSKFICKLFGSLINNIEINKLEDLMHVKPTTSELIEEHLMPLSSSKRCRLLSDIFNNYHKFVFDYFSLCGATRQEKWSLCPKLRHLQHSCVPNVELRSLSDGKYLAKAAMDLKSGTELTVCFNSVEILKQNRKERHDILQKSGIICSCDLCSLPAYIEPVNMRSGILCTFCDQDNIITQLPGKCIQCHADYNEQLQQMKIFISHVLRQMEVKELDPNITQRDLAILYGTYNNYITMHFSEYHELRLIGILSFVEFLTKNGFLKQATDVIIALHCSYYSYYGDNTDCFKKDFAALIFKMVKNILKSYFANLSPSSVINKEPLNQLLVIILHTLKNQEKHLDPSIDDAENYNMILDNYALYYNWKRIVSYLTLMPKALKDYLNLS
ncbi:uncharacterized protein LOC132785798 [Drosophila nasuta]|uniref:uncharacterized protein LOC132785798 n=1 Tax=Drosophila nasuta TaxID=42062 RepID=UPI00295F5903|nr:uncharacterized protein LOC132785798 [Drosophila nasuta]